MKMLSPMAACLGLALGPALFAQGIQQKAKTQKTQQNATRQTNTSIHKDGEDGTTRTRPGAKAQTAKTTAKTTGKTGATKTDTKNKR